ncbi:MAG: YdhR family protein [Alphaproteobacteria bacterium]|nr:YdhR family protein [Alphaproteobacteria bacterium]
MHIVISRFTRPQGATEDELKAKFHDSAPVYRDLEGLVQKFYLMGTDQDDAGGVYVFRTRAEACARFGDNVSARNNRPQQVITTVNSGKYSLN